MRFWHLWILVFSASAFEAAAMEVTGYDPVAHNRFVSGYPGTPVANTDPLFVGRDYDWSGVGWSSLDATKSFGFVSPQHYLVARHYGGASVLRIFGADGAVHERSQRNVAATGLGVVFYGETLGDLSLGSLQSPFPTGAMPGRYGVLDLNSSSTGNSTSAYSNRPLLIYGRGPNGSSSTRIAGTPLGVATVSGNNHSFTTPRTDLQLQGGDSGSPAFASWLNPNGQRELTLVGNHAAVNDTNNLHNFLGTQEVMRALNDLMRPDGRALRVVGTPTHTWEGSSSQNISRNSAWGLGGNPNSSNATSDRFVLFDAGNPSVNVDANYLLRGLYFKGSSFTFSGSRTLTVGRGGVTLYGASPQTFNAALALGADQVWNTGVGMISVQKLTLNDKLLEVLGAGILTIQGEISGTGGLALGGGELHLGATSTYTGTTWVHEGRLRVDGDIASSAAVVLGATGELTGSGTLPEIRGRGRVKPSGTVLTARAVDGSAGLSFDFTFANSTPSGNETLRLTAASPFTAPLSASSTVRVYLDVEGLRAGQRFFGGVFTDATGDFLSAVASARFEIHVFGEEGYEPLDASAWVAEWETAALTHDFGAGPVPGRVLSLTLLPPENTYARWVYEVFPPETPLEDTGPMAAPNEAGIPNLVSYGHGLNPLEPELSQRPLLVRDGDGLVFRWWQNPSALDVTARVQWTADLTADWEDVLPAPEFMGRENGLDRHELRVEPDERLFLRVCWEQNAQP